MEIDVIPSDSEKHGLELAKFKADREEQRLYNAQEELSNLQNEKAILESSIQELREYVNHNAKAIQDWKLDAKKGIETANNIISEYLDFANDVDRRYSAEIQQAALDALGDIPEEPEINYNQSEIGFNSYNYDDEEYEL